MRAAVYTRYGSGDVVTIEERPRPEISSTDVLVRVDSAVVSASDAAARSGSPFIARLFFGLFKPRLTVLGSDFAGVIEAVGSDVARFKVGESVVGSTDATLGAHAEFLRVAADSMIELSPNNASLAEATAAVEGAMTALPFLRDAAALRSGQRILVNGASGSVGSAAVQIAHHLGAHVTAVCSGKNAELVRSIGADEVVDYTKADFTAARDSYDVILDAVAKSSFRRSRAALTSNGIYLTTVPSLGIMLQKMITAKSKGKRAGIMFAGLLPLAEVKKNLAEVVGLIESGAVVPVIERAFAVTDIAAAHNLVDTGHKRGAVVVSF